MAIHLSPDMQAMMRAHYNRRLDEVTGEINAEQATSSEEHHLDVLAAEADRIMARLEELGGECRVKPNREFRALLPRR